ATVTFGAVEGPDGPGLELGADIGGERVGGDGGDGGEAVGGFHGEQPGAFAAHAQAGDVDAVFVDADFGGELIEQGENAFEHGGLVPALAARGALGADEDEGKGGGDLGAALLRQLHGGTVGEHAAGVGAGFASAVEKDDRGAG